MSGGTRGGPAELAASVGEAARRAAGMLRRMIVTRTTAIWQVAGHLLLDGSRETREAEVFGGVGFAARPASDASGGPVEAIVAFMGEGAANPVIIATRQEGVRRMVAADLAIAETQLHNALTIIRIKANGSVEIRTSGGVAAPLATKADLATLKQAISDAVIVGMDGGASLKSTILAALVAWPVGTVVLKAE